MSTRKLRIGIVGGGMAGLAASVALTHAGLECVVFEQAPQIGEIGAGINVSQNATKIFAALGMAERLARVSTVISGQTMRSFETGEQLGETVLSGPDGAQDSAGRFTTPFYVVHRADLVEVLAAHAGRVEVGHRLVDLDEHEDHATLRFANGAEHDFDLVIGADGIRSVVRRKLYGDQPATFTGQTAWRSPIDAARFPADLLGPRGFTMWVGKGRHVIAYHLHHKGVINMTGQSDSARWTSEGWSIPAEPDEMRAEFAGANPTLRSLLDEVTTAGKYGLFGRDPSTDWGRGRVQLIGDAAHAMLPNAGQGAVAGFEDAYILSRWLVEEPDLDRALESFRDVRVPRAHAVQRQSALNAKLVHSGGLAQRRNAFAAREKQGDTPLGVGWIYDYDPVTEWSQRREYPLSAAPAEAGGDDGSRNAVRR